MKAPSEVDSGATRHEDTKPLAFAVNPGVGLVSPRDFVCEDPFPFEQGGLLNGFRLRYETYGTLNTAGTNALLICHALTGDHHAAGYHKPEDRKPGWWHLLVGPGRAVDTNRYYVICSNCLGGCQGSTGPSSINPQTGKPFALDFPLISIRDMVRAQKRLMDHLGIRRLAGIIGGSMGGMQALQWAIEYPDFVDRVIALAVTARQSAQAIAFNEVGRNAIIQDTAWDKGNYPQGGGPSVGLSIARMMAHITYLSEEGMEKRFGRTRRADSLASASDAREQFGVEFEVESYLRYQARTFVNRFDANTYLYFTKALDRFDLYGPSGRLEDTFANVQAKILVIGFSSDWLYPPVQNRAIVHALLRNRKHATYTEVQMSLGHDSFLVDAPEVFDRIRNFLQVSEVSN